MISQPYGGDNRNRTDAPLLAKQVLSQLSYTPVSVCCSYSVVFSSPLLRTLKIRQQLQKIRLTLESLHLHAFLHRKEVIQPQVLLRLPCYDFTPVADSTVEGS